MRQGRRGSISRETGKQISVFCLSGLKKKNNIVFQSLGWLAREDKINYTHRDKKTIVSLSDPEMRIFNSVSQNIRQSLETN